MDISNALKNSEQPIIFVHIEKNGGTTLDNFFRAMCKKYHSEYIWTSTNEVDSILSNNKKYFSNYRFVSGHFDYGISNQIYPGRKCFHFTVVREPLERLFSWYKYVKITPTESAYTNAINMDFNSWVNWLLNINSNYVNNFQYGRMTGLRNFTYETSDAEVLAEKAIDNFDLIIAIEDINSFMNENTSNNLFVDNGKVSLDKSKMLIDKTTKDKFYKKNEIDNAIYLATKAA